MEMQDKSLEHIASKLRRLLPAAILLCLFLYIPVHGYGAEASVVQTAQQQSVKVTGTVIDSSGESVIGANVTVEGTTLGCITDLDGHFTLNVPIGSKLKISFIGYKDKIVTIKKGVSLNIELENDSQMLGEVQVVAYGVQKKVSVTGAISSMKGDDLLKTPVALVKNMLSGQVTGVSSVQYSGEPGADVAASTCGVSLHIPVLRLRSFKWTAWSETCRK